MPPSSPHALIHPSAFYCLQFICLGPVWMALVVRSLCAPNRCSPDVTLVLKSGTSWERILTKMDRDSRLAWASLGSFPDSHGLCEL
ncbi:hypothetical protein BGW80DRAFT_1310212 [Lactifluus volemus]|nr:hypothetical protein BGW80DRAFT_1310212 [Lactifluus volemus]